jgi:methylmalonyl-CoA mutase
VKQHAQPVAIRTEIGTDFFLEIARLRALRLVWNKLSERPYDLHLHVCSSPWTPEAYAPHANMLKATTAAMAAILGGADSLTVDPESPEQPMQRRVARNVSILLREESRFAKVADPLAGAYFVDRLTHDLAEKIEAAIQLRVRS